MSISPKDFNEMHDQSVQLLSAATALKTILDKALATTQVSYLVHTRQYATLVGYYYCPGGAAGRRGPTDDLVAGDPDGLSYFIFPANAMDINNQLNPLTGLALEQFNYCLANCSASDKGNEISKTLAASFSQLANFRNNLNGLFDRFLNSAHAIVCYVKGRNDFNLPVEIGNIKILEDYRDLLAKLCDELDQITKWQYPAQAS